MSQNNNGRTTRARLRLVAMGFVGLILVAAAALVLPGWRARQVTKLEEDPKPLSPQEVAEVKVAAEKQTGTLIGYVGGIRQGVVEVFPDVGRGLPAFRVKKTDEGWKVIEMFHAYFA
jgi:hypothetical protein